MTLTEWKKAVRVLHEGKGFTTKDGVEILQHMGRYGTEYSVRAPGYGCIIATWDLMQIKDILVHQ